MLQHRRPPQSAQRARTAAQVGFGMLEVIVSLVILAIGTSVAFTWLSQTVSTVGRLRAQESELIARVDVLEVVRTLNPTKTPEGSLQMAQYRVDWRSVESQPALPARGRFNATGIFKVALYDVDAKVYDKTGKLWFSLALPVAGYAQTGRASEISPLSLQAPAAPK